LFRVDRVLLGKNACRNQECHNYECATQHGSKLA
jgi:hypothetical protein